MIRRLPILLLIACSLVLAACGQEEQDPGGFQTENAQVAETEGIYLELGEAKYQVQLSKQLNPALPDDGPYLQDINSSEDRLEGDQVWFAVWMRVENESDDEPIESATDFVIRDTQENEYLPVSIEPTNEWSYQPTRIAPKRIYPGPNTPAGERSPNGAMLLFRVSRPSLDNRPLELEVTGPEGERAIVDLDV
jgi:hypothetical protein